MTRAAPARILGLADRGHLGVGAAADVVLYEPHADPEAMFAKPRYVFKDGEVVAERGEIKAAAVRQHPRGEAGVRCRHRAHAGATTSSATRRCRCSTSRSATTRCASWGARPGSSSIPAGRLRHERAQYRRRGHRGHLRRGLRHARHAAGHHGRQPAVGAPRRHHGDRLRHLGDRLRLRGGHRDDPVAARDARRPAGRGDPASSPCRARICRSSSSGAPGNACSPARPRRPTAASRRRRRTTGSGWAARCAISATASRSPS